MTILNTTTVDVVTGIEDYFSWSIGCWFGIILTIACVIGFTYFLIETIKEKEIGFLGMGILCLVVGAVILAEIVLPHDVITTVNQYEVTLNENIAFKEIMDKYDFIEQRGDIYVLREKLPEGVTELKNDK